MTDQKTKKELILEYLKTHGTIRSNHDPGRSPDLLPKV